MSKNMLRCQMIGARRNMREVMATGCRGRSDPITHQELDS